MSNSVDPDDEPSHLDIRCLQKPIIIAYGSQRVRLIDSVSSLADTEYKQRSEHGKHEHSRLSATDIK